MRFALVIIGNELLDGSRVDANTSYLGSRLTSLGGEVVAAALVRDDASTIERTVASMLDRADVVITSGGLGVTADDRTKHAVSKLMGRKLVLDEDVLERVRERFESRGAAMPESNIAQAMVPEGARVIENQRGTAPGLMFESGDTLLFVLPGVPSELRAMFDGYVSPFLEGRGLKPLAQERTIRTTGLPESRIAELTSALAKRLARTEVAYLPSLTGVDLKVVGKGQTPLEAEKTAESSADKLAVKLEPYVYARGDESLEKVVGYLLAMADQTVAVAESCTGGRLGWRLTRVPGSSDYFRGGVISYSNELKKKLLGVKAGTLKRHGAVSPHTAVEMADGVRAKCATDVGVSVTGIAGPSGASKKKPIGLVYVAVTSEERERVREFSFSGTRGAVRRQATQAALDTLRRFLLSIEDD